MPTYITSSYSPEYIGPLGPFVVKRAGVELYTVPACSPGTVPQKGMVSTITTETGHHKGTSCTHYVREWEYFPSSSEVFVDVTRDANGNYQENASSLRECFNTRDGYAAAWLGSPTPTISHQPLDHDVLVVGTAPNDSLIRDAHARFLTQEEAQLSVDIAELDQTWGTLPTLMKGMKKALHAARRILNPKAALKSTLREEAAAFDRAARVHGLVWHDHNLRWKTAKSYKKWLKQARRSTMQRSSPLTRRVADALSAGGLVISGGHLAYQFGAKPLAGTVSALVDARVRADDSLRRGVASYNLDVSVDDAKLGSLYSQIDGAFVATNVWRDPYRNGSYWHLSSKPSGRAKAVVSGRINYPVKGPVASFIRKYVASGFASVAYELVPFSFVIDWFVDTRAVLGTLDAYLQGASIEIKNCSLSSKIDWRVNAIGHNYSANASVGTRTDVQGRTVWSFRLRQYKRNQVQVPSGLAWNWKYGENQRWLTLSLVLQKLL